MREYNIDLSEYRIILKTLEFIKRDSRFPRIFQNQELKLDRDRLINKLFRLEYTDSRDKVMRYVTIGLNFDASQCGSYIRVKCELLKDYYIDSSKLYDQKRIHSKVVKSMIRYPNSVISIYHFWLELGSSLGRLIYDGI